MYGEVNGWRPDSFENNKANSLKAADNFKKLLGKMMKYLKSVQTVRSELSQEKSKTESQCWEPSQHIGKANGFVWGSRSTCELPRHCD